MCLSINTKLLESRIRNQSESPRARFSENELKSREHATFSGGGGCVRHARIPLFFPAPLDDCYRSTKTIVDLTFLLRIAGDREILSRKLKVKYVPRFHFFLLSSSYGYAYADYRCLECCLGWKVLRTHVRVRMHRKKNREPTDLGTDTVGSRWYCINVRSLGFSIAPLNPPPKQPSHSQYRAARLQSSALTRTCIHVSSYMHISPFFSKPRVHLYIKSTMGEFKKEKTSRVFAPLSFIPFHGTCACQSWVKLISKNVHGCNYFLLHH